MATQAYTIYSHYDPADRKLLEIETGQVETEESWVLESTEAFPRRLAPAPRFVPASKDYSASDSTQPEASSSRKQDSDVSDWYRSLPRERKTVQVQATISASSESAKPAVERMKATKNDWFILNALKSQATPLPVQSNSTLADLLDRNPPPRPSEPKFTPPIFLAIGPSNKGFSILERSGWSEGEALGRDVVRKAKDKAREESTTTINTPIDSDSDIWQVKHVPTIDLTLSDSEEADVDLTIPSDDDNSPHAHKALFTSIATFSDDDNSAHARKALLTPIATVLKSDRLGIGLKAKSAGPYKESVKRVTHSAAALAAHMKASQDLHRWKKHHGRGRRGFAKRQKEEEDRRRAMVAYMNT